MLASFLSHVAILIFDFVHVLKILWAKGQRERVVESEALGLGLLYRQSEHVTIYI